MSAPTTPENTAGQIPDRVVVRAARTRGIPFRRAPIAPGPSSPGRPRRLRAGESVLATALTVDAQRDLASAAHRSGAANLQVLALLSDRHRLLLVEHSRTVHGDTPLWTVPSLFVLPGELIGDALKRLCRQYLRFDPAARMIGYLGATTDRELEGTAL